MKEICTGFYEACSRGTVSSHMWLERKDCIWWGLMDEDTEMLKDNSEEVGWSHAANCLEIMVRSLGFTGHLVRNYQMFLKGNRASELGFLDFSKFLLDFTVPSLCSSSGVPVLFRDFTLCSSQPRWELWIRFTSSFPSTPWSPICQWLSTAQRSPSSPAFHFQL